MIIKKNKKNIFHHIDIYLNCSPLSSITIQSIFMVLYTMEFYDGWETFLRIVLSKLIM